MKLFLLLLLYTGIYSALASVTIYTEIISVSAPIVINANNLTETLQASGINITIRTMAVVDVAPPATTSPYLPPAGTSLALSTTDLLLLIGIPLVVLLILAWLYQTYPPLPGPSHHVYQPVLPYAISAPPSDSFEQYEYIPPNQRPPKQFYGKGV